MSFNIVMASWDRKPRHIDSFFALDIVSPLHHVSVNVVRVHLDIMSDEDLPEDIPLQEVSTNLLRG